MCVIRDLDRFAFRFNSVGDLQSAAMEEAILEDINMFNDKFRKFKSLKCYFPEPLVKIENREKKQDSFTKNLINWLKFRACIFYESHFKSLPKKEADLTNLLPQDKLNMTSRCGRILADQNASKSKVTQALGELNSIWSSLSCYEIKHSRVLGNILNYLQGEHAIIPYQERWALFLKVIDTKMLAQTMQSFLDRYGYFPIIKFDNPIPNATISSKYYFVKLLMIIIAL